MDKKGGKKKFDNFTFKKWGLSYFLSQLLVNSVLRLHFRKFVITGKENIPHGKPIIYAPTHRNALIDALILVYENVKNQVVFLARADIFKKKTERILHFLRIMPVYRIRDGKENLSKNQEIFEQCGVILKKRNPICLFPEARFNPHQNLLPLQKAIPRIALPTEAKNDFELDTHIVPMAFYYTAKDSFLSDLYITYGKPLKVADYKELYLRDENQAINQLRNDMDARLREYVVDIPEEDYEEISAWIDLKAEEVKRKSFPGKDGIIRASQQIISEAKELKENKPKEYVEKINTLKNLINSLNSKGLSTKDLRNKPLNSTSIIIRTLLLTLTFPIALIGILNTVFPILIYKKLLKVVKDKQFISSIRVVCGIFIVPLFYIIQFLLVGIICGNWTIALIYLLSSPILFYFGSYWRKWWKGVIKMKSIRSFKKEKKDEWMEIVESLRI